MDLDLSDLRSFFEQVLGWISAGMDGSDGSALSAERKPYETYDIKRGNWSAKENAELDGIEGRERSDGLLGRDWRV